MYHSRKTIPIDLENEISLETILSWSRQFDPCVILNSNTKEQQQKDNYHTFDLLIAVDSVRTVPQNDDLFNSIRLLHDDISDWLVGYISYDVKNQIEKLPSSNYDGELA